MSGTAGCSLEALEKRVGHFEDLAGRLLERLEGLTQRVDGRLAQRLAAVELELEGKASAELCRELVAEALRPLDAWAEGLAQAAGRRPRLRLPAEAPRPPAARAEGGCPEEKLRPAPPEGDRHARTLEADERNNGGQRPNMPLSLIVVQTRWDEAPQAGKCQEVTVEVRAADRISDVKQKALDQLEMWGRFCNIGRLAEDDHSEEEEEEEASAAATLPLPPTEACRLYAETGRLQRRPLREQDSVAESDLRHGMRLLLVPEPAREQPPQPAPPRDRQAPAPPPSLERPPAEPPVPPEQERPPPQCQEGGSGSGQSGPVSFVVGHQEGEVTVEARSSDSVQFVKVRAHAQLTVWYRFCELSDAPSSSLPPLEECDLWRMGADGGEDVLLRERLALEECGLENGQRLALRARG